MVPSRVAPRIALSCQRVMMARWCRVIGVAMLLGYSWESPESDLSADAYLLNMAGIALRCDECSLRHAGVLWLSWCRWNDIVVFPNVRCRRRINDV